MGAIEPQFYAQLLHGLGIPPADLPDQNDRDQWPLLRKLFTDTIAAHSRDHWATVFADTDACVTPVLTLDEVAAGDHLAHRGTIIEIDEVPQPAPAPRFSRTPAATPTGPRQMVTDTEDVLDDWIGTRSRSSR